MPPSKARDRLYAGLFLLSIFIGPFSAWAQTEGLPVSPTADAPSTFQSHWTGQFEAGYSYWQGGGQYGADFSLTGTDHLNPAGSFLSVAVLGETQQLEHVTVPSGGFYIEGGVGLQGWVSSISLLVQRGDDDYDSLLACLNDRLELSSGVSLFIYLGGEAASHDGPLASYLALPQGTAEVDGLNGVLGAQLTGPIDRDLGYSLGFQSNLNETVKIQDLSHQTSDDLNTMDTVSAFIPGLDFDFSDHWTVQVSGRFGWDDAPAGTYYSERLGKTLTAASSSTETFTGGSLDLAVDF